MEKKQVKKNYEMLDRWIKIEVMDRQMNEIDTKQTDECLIDKYINQTKMADCMLIRIV